MFYLIIKDSCLINIYQQIPEPTLLDRGISIEQVESLPQGLKVGQVRRKDGVWVDPPNQQEDWQAFINKLDIPERGGNGGYQLAINGAAKIDALSAYTLVILLLRGVAKDIERLTLQYHIQQVCNLQPELRDKLQEALEVGRINFQLE